MASPGLKRHSLSKPCTATTSSPRAFYELPENKPTAAQIVRESRDWLQAVSTRRPYTPKDQSRSLFGPGYKPASSRPLSAFKLSAQSFDPSDSTKNRFPESINPVEHASFRPVGAEGLLTPDIARVRLLYGQGRGRVLKKFTFVEETLPSPSVPHGVQCNGFGKSTALTSNRSPNQPNVTKLELIGTQSKLLKPMQPKLLTPSLSVMTTQRMAGNVQQESGKEESHVQRAKPITSSGIKRGSKSGQTRSRQSPVTGYANSAPSSATRKLKSPGSIGSDVYSNGHLLPVSNKKPWEKSGNLLIKDYRKIEQGELDPNGKQELQDGLAETSVPCDNVNSETTSVLSTDDGLPLLEPAMFERMHKPEFNELQHQQDQLLQTTNLTPASGDSGLSSGNELDHLTARLIELSQLLHSFSTAELQLDSEESDMSQEAGPVHASSGDFNEMEVEAEQQVISLLDKTHSALRESDRGGKRGGSNRTVLLQTLFSLLDRSSPRLHLALARVILTIQVNGTNLANICKLLYKVAKEAHNDALFLEHPDTLGCLIDTVQLLDTAQLSTMPSTTEPADHVLDNCDALLFLTGTLKFLAASPVVAKSLHSHPAFLNGLFSVHKHVQERIQAMRSSEGCSVVSDDKQYNLEERLYLVLVQISEIFCNLTGNPELRAQLLPKGGVLDHVIDCLVSDKKEPIQTPKSTSNSSARHLVQFNWIRLLARLTEYTEVCLRLESWDEDKVGGSRQGHDDVSTKDVPLIKRCTVSDTANVIVPRVTALCTTLFSMIQAYSEDTDLIVRIAYLLGNLTARLDSAREALFPNTNALAGMCALCRFHHQAMGCNSNTDASSCITSRKEPADAWSTNSTSSAEQMSPEPKHQTHTEVVNKLVRVLANAAIGETVGRLVVTDTECVDLLLDLIFHECPWRPSELLVNCLAGLNNITYYIHADSNPDVLAKQYHVAEVLLRTLCGGTAHPDVLLGVIRVFGNLTRQASVREWIARHAGQLILDGTRTANAAQPRAVWPKTVNEDQILLYMLIQNLDSARPELVYSTLGVLINMMTDIDQRPTFRQLGGITKLVEVLRDFAGHDWQLAGLACKTLWNYTETPVESIRSLVDAETLNELYNLLSEFTDQDVVNQIHQSFSVHDPETEQESMNLWQAAWSSEFFPVASEFLSRLAYC